MESKFKYWKTVKAALVLGFNNLMLTVTLIIFGFFETLFIALFLSRIPVLKAYSLGNVQLRLNPQTVILFFILILVIIVLSAFVSGWLFFRIGNIVRKTESKIFDFKASLRKGWVFLRSMILAKIIERRNTHPFLNDALKSKIFDSVFLAMFPILKNSHPLTKADKTIITNIK